MEIICNCGSKTGELILTPNSVHYGKIVCLCCRKFIKWQTAPQNEGQRTSCPNVETIANYHNFSEPFCFFCGRQKYQLGWNETLTVDHIKKLEENGENIKKNMQILCSACHKLKHWSELYMRKHLEKFYNEQNTKN